MVALFGFAGLLAPGGKAQETASQLVFADAVRMLNCEPVSSAPCFRIKFNIVDEHANPAPAALVTASQLAQSIKVVLDGQPVAPFYAAAQDTTASVRGRTALILVDISGSMNQLLPTGQTRFEGAKAALREFVDQFQDGIDEVAIVPFESHNVKATIQSARFSSSKADTLRQVEELPRPRPQNNTGLYSAVESGLEVLTRHAEGESAASRDRQVMLILMTDGKNEVRRGDDEGLLDGPDGLNIASGQVKSSGTEVLGIGFGNLAEIDEDALTHLSTRVFMAPDSDTLRRTFAIARTLLNSRITATFNSSLWPDRASLASHTMEISAAIKLASGKIVSSGKTTWAAPAMGLPLFAGNCTDQEREALFQQNPPGRVDWTSILRPCAVFLGLSLLLLMLWFWAPRLIWADQYSGLREDLHRWEAPVSRTAGNSRAPAGFTSAGRRGPVPNRTPGDATTVQPQTSTTKTRLG